MIKITISKRNGCYHSMEFDGHAGFRRFGKDIVCASVSVLVLNTINSIEKFTKDISENDTVTGDGYIRVNFPDNLSHDSILLLDSMVFGLENIQKNYGSKYISLQCKEVQEHVTDEPSVLRS